MVLSMIVLMCMVCVIMCMWRAFSSGNDVYCILTQHTVYDEALTQGSLMFVQSILEICSIEAAEGGDYTCNATNGFVSETNTTTITVVDNRGVCVCVMVCVCV